MMLDRLDAPWELDDRITAYDPDHIVAPVLDGGESAMREPRVRGLIPGRALLHPSDGDVAGIVGAAATIVHADDGGRS